MLINVIRKSLQPRYRLAAIKNSIKCYSSAYETSISNDDFRTTVDVLNKKKELGLMIDSYGPYGFRLNLGMFLLGPIALFPHSVLSWKVNSPQQIDQQSLTLFYTLEPKIDILILGYGDKTTTGSPINPDAIRFLQKQKIYFEMLPTESACTTYNFLMSERRLVAGALIPPSKLSIRDCDVFDTTVKNRTFSDFQWGEKPQKDYYDI